MSKIVVLVFIFTIALQGAFAGLAAVQMKSIEKCKEGTNITPEKVSQLFHDGITEEDSNENIKCFLRCYMLEMNEMLPDGTITLPEAMEAKAGECAIRDETDLCERAFQFGLCLHKKMNHGWMD